MSILLTREQRIKVFNAIPNILCGKEIPKRITEQYVQAPEVPGIEITYLTQGVRARWSSSPITVVYNREKYQYEERWGQMHKCVISVTINSFDKAELFDLASEMLKEIFRTRLGFYWPRDRVKFIDVISEPIFTSVRVEQYKKLVHRAHIDIWLEYELSWWLDADPAIRRFGYEINDYLTGMLFEPGSYGCSVNIVR